MYVKKNKNKRTNLVIKNELMMKKMLKTFLGA